MSVGKKEDVVEKGHKVPAAFIKEHMKLVSDKDGKRFQVNQEHYQQFLEGQGITKETLKQVATATASYNNGTISVLKDLLLDNAEDERIKINTRTPSGVISTQMTRRVEARTPGTGESITKYGVVSIRVNLKARMDADLLAECSKEIEEASK